MGKSTVGPIQHPNWDLTQLGKWVGSIEVILSATNYKSPGGGGEFCVLVLASYSNCHQVG